MIASWARSPTWAIGSQADKLWATFCVDTRSHQRRSGGARPPGRSSPGRTWTCSPATEQSLRRAVSNFLEHFHHERNHQGRANCSYSPQARLHLQLKLPPFAVRSGLVAYSSTTAAPHEFFGHMGDQRLRGCDFGSESKKALAFVA